MGTGRGGRGEHLAVGRELAAGLEVPLVLAGDNVGEGPWAG